MTERVVPESAIEERLREISSEIARLEAEREALIGLLSSHGVEGKAFVKSAMQQQEAAKRRRHKLEVAAHRRPSPKEAVFNTVQRHPGWSRKQIVNRLEDVVDSSADDVRAVLYTALRRLEDEGEVFRRDDRVYPADDPRVRFIPRNSKEANEARNELLAKARRLDQKTKGARGQN